MPGVTRTWVCLPYASATVTWLTPDPVVTIAATGTVSTGPSVRPVSTVTRTFSLFSAAGSGLDGVTVSGMNGVPSGFEAPPELFEPPAPAAPVDPEPVEPDAVDPAAAAEDEPPPTSTIAPIGAIVVAVPVSATVPVAWMPVTSSKIFTFRPVLT